jgi:hypothetical protein
MAQVTEMLFEKREDPGFEPGRRPEFFAFMLNVRSDAF